MNLDHCTITSPIDGVVVERDVDEGQAVSAGVQAPKLFILATNLKHLQLLGSTDEADVSQKRVFFGGINVYLQQKSRLGPA